MANKLYQIHACGHFNAGDVNSCYILAPDESSARCLARTYVASFADAVLFVEELEIEYLTGYTFGHNFVSIDCYIYPDDKKVGCYHTLQEAKPTPSALVK